MSFFMGKKFVGFGGKGSQKGPQKGPEVVFDSGEDGNRKMKRMLTAIMCLIQKKTLGLSKNR